MSEHSVRALELARAAWRLQQQHRKDLTRALQPLIDVTGANEATLLGALGVASNADSDAAALATFTAASELLESVADFAKEPQPAPVLWRDPGDNVRHEPRLCDAVLSVGETGILSSAGGIGKSTLALEVASAAATAAENGKLFGTACGLRVAAGPVVLVSYEDSVTRIAHRMTWINSTNLPKAVRVWRDPDPLWCADPAQHGASQAGSRWPQLWAAVRNVGARMVVIDPVSATLADASTSETGPVRAFLRALAREAAPNDTECWKGCGVLLIAHDTKNARDAIRRGEDPGAGVVAGSAAWYDGARGVLALMRDPNEGSEDRLLECVKANYGRTGWGARVAERLENDAYRGLEMVMLLVREEMDEAKKKSDKEDPFE